MTDGTASKYTVVRYHGPDDVRHGIAGPAGTKWLHIVLMDAPVRIVKVPAEETRFVSALGNAKLQTAARTLLRAGKKLGITEGAKAFLKEALAA